MAKAALQGVAAGFDRTKTDLNRDVAYLTRLWKVMEKRIETAGTPCELYTESDLLIRTLRDLVDSSIDGIVVDSESAFSRTESFLKVFAPRSAPELLYFDKQLPIFHAFQIERQIDVIHSREVPLPSGGALVIEQTEALVAIDVNSGKSRSATSRGPRSGPRRAPSPRPRNPQNFGNIFRSL